MEPYFTVYIIKTTGFYFCTHPFHEQRLELCVPISTVSRSLIPAVNWNECETPLFFYLLPLLLPARVAWVLGFTESSDISTLSPPIQLRSTFFQIYKQSKDSHTYSRLLRSPRDNSYNQLETNCLSYIYFLNLFDEYL